MSTVILGTGIIGASTAYYLSLSQSPSTIHLVEPSPTLFASASGFAGGFLAKDWFSTSTEALGAFSFDEHKRLAEEHGGREKWGYSKTTTWNYSPGSGKKTTGDGEKAENWLFAGTSRADAAAQFSGSGTGQEPRWLSRMEGDSVEIISKDGSTAQVDPLKLSQFLLSQCLERGVQFHHPAKAVSIGKDMREELASVRVVSTDSSSEVDIPCTRIVITAGAWSPQVFETLFPGARTKLPITALSGHSMVVKSPRWAEELETKNCHAIYTTDESGAFPEMYSRVGGEIYLAGLNDASIPLPGLAIESKVYDTVVEKLQFICKRLLGLPSGIDDLEVVRTSLCFRPVTSKGAPILSRIADEKLGGVKTRGGSDGGVFLAAGHGPWGISMSLGTGKVMAEMVQALPTSVDIKGLGF